MNAITVGSRFTVRVSGKVTTVLILAVRRSFAIGRKAGFREQVEAVEAKNEATGRKLTLSPARLLSRV